MISIERATNLINGMDTERIREITCDRVEGRDITTTGSGHSFEPSEDVVIQLLRNSELASEKRKAVIKGCIDVYRKVQEWIDDLDWNANIQQWQDTVMRLCRVVDMAEPPELENHAKPFLVRLLGEDRCPPELLGAAVRAYMAFGQSEKSARFWEEDILTNRYVAAYGFNALLDIDPKHKRIEEHLYKLWSLQLVDHWPVDSAFLMERATQQRNEENLIYRVLHKLKNEHLWTQVETELRRREWSSGWLSKLDSSDHAAKHITGGIKVKQIDLGATRPDFYETVFFVYSHPIDISTRDSLKEIFSRLEKNGIIDEYERQIESHKEIGNAEKNRLEELIHRG